MGSFLPPVVRKIIDPGSIFTGTPDIGGLIDPGGEIIEAATGSTAAREIADPLGLLADPDLAAISPKPGEGIAGGGIDIAAQEKIAIDEAKRKEDERKKRIALLGRESTFKTSPFGLTTEADVSSHDVSIPKIVISYNEILILFFFIFSLIFI